MASSSKTTAAPAASSSTSAAGTGLPSSSTTGVAGTGLGLGSSSSSSMSNPVGASGSGIGLGPLAGVPTSVYPTDTVKDIAESLGITGLKDSVAAALAADVEYRIREIVQDAAKYMRHAKRDQLKTTDVDAALRARNIEPLYGFLPSSSSSTTFRRVQTSSGVPIHYVEDDEIDFENILQAGPRIGVGRGVGWGAHWLAIEGVQPAVPQNPSPSSLASEAASGSGFAAATPPLPPSATAATAAPAAKAVAVAGGDGQAVAKPLVKHILSRELQLYYERLTKAIVSPPPEADEDLDDDLEDKAADKVETDVDQDGDVEMDAATSPKDTLIIMTPPPRPTTAKPLATFVQKGSGNHVRDAALASLRGDPGLHQLVPYLIQFVGGKVIEVLRGNPSQDSQGQDHIMIEKDSISTTDNHMLSVMLSTIHAMLVNPHIFIEPYLHQMMPSILSILLTSSLAEPSAVSTQQDQEVYSPVVTAGPSSYSLRAHASALLAHIVEKHSKSYPTLKPRVVATLLKALMSGVVQEPDQVDTETKSSPVIIENNITKTGPKPNPGTKLGAIMALGRLGKSSFRVLLVSLVQNDPCPLLLLGQWMESWAHQDSKKQQLLKPLIREIIGGLHSLLPPYIDPNSTYDQEKLKTFFGSYWIEKLDTRSKIALENQVGDSCFHVKQEQP